MHSNMTQIFHIKQENSYFDVFSNAICIFIVNLTILSILTDDNLYLYSKIHQINNTKQRNTLNTSINKVEMIKLLI